MIANAARAVDAGLAASSRARPPPLYSYDPDIGRLAVTTPKYNTAIVAVNQKAFPYGGLDLARLFDGKQEVAANIGGRPPASFGLMVRDVAGRRVAASQVGRSRVDPGVRPLTLTKAPRGAGAVSSAGRPRLRRTVQRPARDRRDDRPRLLLRVTHRFTRDFIQTRWDATRRSPATAATPRTRCSRARAARRLGVVAVLRNGSAREGGHSPDPARLGHVPLRAQRVQRLRRRAGRHAPAGAGVHVMRPPRRAPPRTPARPPRSRSPARRTSAAPP